MTPKQGKDNHGLNSLIQCSQGKQGPLLLGRNWLVLGTGGIVGLVCEPGQEGCAWRLLLGSSKWPCALLCILTCSTLPKTPLLNL